MEHVLSPFHVLQVAANRVHPAPQGQAAKGAPAGPQEEPDIVIDCPAPLPACNASRLKTLHDLRMSSDNKGPMEHVDHIINMVISVFEVPSAWITILGDEVSDTSDTGRSPPPLHAPSSALMTRWRTHRRFPCVQLCFAQSTSCR